MFTDNCKVVLFTTKDVLRQQALLKVKKLSPKLLMCCSCQDIADVSPEYSEFIKEYYKFRKYCLQTSQLLTVINILIQLGIGLRNTQVFDLYTQALEAHMAATTAFIQLVALHEMLVQKYWNSSHG